MSSYVLINKKILLNSQVKISINDRSFRYGDGLFETMKVIDGVIYNFEAHYARMLKGLKALQISLDTYGFKNDCYKLLKRNKVKSAILRVCISRGEGSIGYLPKNSKPILIAQTIKIAKSKCKKITLGVSKQKLWKKDLKIASCKTAQSLNYIIARIESSKKGYFDDIMLNYQNHVSECSSANIFWIKGGKIFTPPAESGIVNGTTRSRLIKNLPYKINFAKSRIETVLAADEVFITNSSLLALPVDEVVFKRKKYKFKKQLVSKIIEFINMDIKKYCIKNHVL